MPLLKIRVTTESVPESLAEARTVAVLFQIDCTRLLVGAGSDDLENAEFLAELPRHGNPTVAGVLVVNEFFLRHNSCFHFPD